MSPTCETATHTPTRLAAVPDPTPPSRTEAATYLVCDDCDLTSGPMQAAEAAFLVRIHDQIQHRGRPTARVQDAAEVEATLVPATDDDTTRLVA